MLHPAQPPAFLKQLAHVRLKENVRGVEVPQAKFELLFLGGLQAVPPVVRGRTSCKAFDQLDRVLDLMNQRGAFFRTAQPRVERDTVQTRIKGSLDVIRNAEVQHGVVAQLRVGGKERVVPDQLIQLPGTPRFLAVIDEVHLAVVDLEAPLAVVAAIPAGLPAHRLTVRAPCSMRSASASRPTSAVFALMPPTEKRMSASFVGFLLVVRLIWFSSNATYDVPPNSSSFWISIPS